MLKVHQKQLLNYLTLLAWIWGSVVGCVQGMFPNKKWLANKYGHGLQYHGDECLVILQACNWHLAMFTKFYSGKAFDCILCVFRCDGVHKKGRQFENTPLPTFTIAPASFDDVWVSSIRPIVLGPMPPAVWFDWEWKQIKPLLCLPLIWENFHEFFKRH